MSSSHEEKKNISLRILGSWSDNLAGSQKSFPGSALFVLLLQTTLSSEGLTAGRDKVNPVLKILWKLRALHLHEENQNLSMLQSAYTIYICVETT